MQNKIILASKSKVRKDILDNNNILSEVRPSNVDEDIVKESLIKEKASSDILDKYNLKSSSEKFFMVSDALSV